MKRNPVGWFEIYVQDMEAAKKFYEAVFDTQLQKGDSSELDLWMFPGDSGRPGSAGALAQMEGVPSGGNSTLVYFSCADCAVESRRAGENGGTIFKPKTSIGQYGYIALFPGPDGNALGLHSMS